MAAKKPVPPTYLDCLLAELEKIAIGYQRVLSDSGVVNIDPNSSHGSSGISFIGYARWGWADSSNALETSRMELLRQVRDWEPRFRLLFPHPTTSVSRRLDEYLDRLMRWLLRQGGDRRVPSSIDRAAAVIAATVTGLRELAELLPADEYAVRLAVDTNTLIDNPDLAAHVPRIGRRYVVHLLPVVLREIDDYKRAGRTPELREAARRAERRLKGIRMNGDVRTGVRVAEAVHAVFEHTEPRADSLPSWLDLTVPDDRFVASTLVLQSRHPGSAFYVATGDINLQTKLEAVGLPHIELP